MLSPGQYERLVLSVSNERDQWHLLVGAAWCEGYRAGELAHADDYARGVLAGAAVRKHAEHDLVEWARLEVLRWGEHGREHFGDPRPGDFPGELARQEAIAAGWNRRQAERRSDLEASEITRGYGAAE